MEVCQSYQPGFLPGTDTDVEVCATFWTIYGDVYRFSNITPGSHDHHIGHIAIPVHSSEFLQLELGKELLNSCLTVAGLVAQLDFVMDARKGDGRAPETRVSMSGECQCRMVHYMVCSLSGVIAVMVCL